MTETREPAAISDITTFRDLLAGRWVGPALHAAATLNIADALAGEPKPAVAVADAVGADPIAVQRLLRALATIGMVGQRDGEYELTSLGALLRADTPGRFRDQVLFTGGERSQRSWARFTDCVRTGNTATKILDGVDDPFDWLAARPDEQTKFDAAMAEQTRQVAAAIAHAYDFSGITNIVDIGGGYGTLLPPVLHNHPAMSGIVFDRPHCETTAEKIIATEQLDQRYTFQGGDFFTDALPAGADAYLLKMVIHDWDDDRSVAILRRCRDAMRDGSRLLIIEVVLPERLDQVAEHRRMIWADLNMLVTTGGRERTETEYRALAAAAGLAISRILPTDTPTKLSVVEMLPS